MGWAVALAVRGVSETSWGSSCRFERSPSALAVPLAVVAEGKAAASPRILLDPRSRLAGVVPPLGSYFVTLAGSPWACTIAFPSPPSTRPCLGFSRVSGGARS
jgi:hypothetical protein